MQASISESVSWGMAGCGGLVGVGVPGVGVKEPWEVPRGGMGCIEMLEWKPGWGEGKAETSAPVSNGQRSHLVT
jgi:hypothetical protein